MENSFFERLGHSLVGGEYAIVIVLLHHVIFPLLNSEQILLVETRFAPFLDHPVSPQEE
jgi:hypothetical protein